MNLTELLQGIELKAAAGALTLPISGLAYDSRSAKPGCLFFATKGLAVDGNRFVGHTTPESPDTQQFLTEARNAGCRFALAALEEL